MLRLEKWRCNENVIANIKMKYMKVYLIYNFKKKNQCWRVLGKLILLQCMKFLKIKIPFFGNQVPQHDTWSDNKWMSRWEEWDLMMRSMVVNYDIKLPFSCKLVYFWISVFRDNGKKNIIRSPEVGAALKTFKLNLSP